MCESRVAANGPNCTIAQHVIDSFHKEHEMKIDLTTKLLLAAIALGLFLNAVGLFIPVAHAQGFNYTTVDGHVTVTLSGGSHFSPLVVDCKNCR